jgi:hypothetical protein
MIVRTSHKLHPELDFAAARRVFEADTHEPLTGELINGKFRGDFGANIHSDSNDIPLPNPNRPTASIVVFPGKPHPTR